MQYIKNYKKAEIISKMFTKNTIIVSNQMLPFSEFINYSDSNEPILIVDSIIPTNREIAAIKFCIDKNIKIIAHMYNRDLEITHIYERDFKWLYNGIWYDHRIIDMNTVLFRNF